MAPYMQSQSADKNEQKEKSRLCVDQCWGRVTDGRHATARILEEMAAHDFERLVAGHGKHLSVLKFVALHDLP